MKEEMKMNRVFTISGFSDEMDSDIKKQFCYLKELGISYFEPRGINEQNISELTLEQAGALKQLMDQYSIKASSIGSPIGKVPITEPLEPQVEKLRHVIKIAETLETRYIRVFSFYIPEEDTPEKWEAEVIHRMRKMAEIAEEFGIVLLHENEHGIYGETAECCLRLLEKVNSPALSCVFDMGNFVFCGHEAYPHAFRLLKDRITYLHIKDAKFGGEIVPPGEGDSHIPEILSELAETGRQYFISLEPHLGYFKGLEALSGHQKLQNLEESGFLTFSYAHRVLLDILQKGKQR